MRDFNSTADTLLASIATGGRPGVVQLVEMQFDTPLYLTTAGWPIIWNSRTWSPAGLGPIQALEATAGELPPLQFTMPGVSDVQKALALEDVAEGVVVIVYDAILDPSTGACADAVRAWAGSLNVPTLVDGAQADLSVTAEHRGMLALRVKPSRYTNDEQQRLHPGDTCLDFDPATDAKPLPWPAASYFRQ